VTDPRDPKGTGSDPSAGARVGAKRAFMESLAAKLAAAGNAARPPSPATPKPVPPPVLTFEAWAELSARFAGAPPSDLAAALAAGGVTLEVWRRFDDAYGRGVLDDIRAGQGERPAIFEAKHKEEQARQAGTPVEGTPPARSTSGLAPAHLSGTSGLPDLPAGALATLGRMPFVPPAPAPEREGAAPGKRAPKTVESKVVPSPVGGQTMDLEAALQRPTPDTPFAGSAGGAGVVYVPALDARQYVSLCAELTLRSAPRAQTQRRYWVPNEAAFRALEADWKHPARRPELEAALADFAVMLRAQLFQPG
jgi:hypothetical protein